MSWTRSKYDACAYQKDLKESVSQLDYLLDPNKFYNCNECRIEFGLFGGNNVSRSMTNLVDVESELLNINRQLTSCPERKYLPICGDCEANPNDGYPCGSLDCRMHGNAYVQSHHLPACNMIQYPPRINNVGFNLTYPGCPSCPKPISAEGMAQKFPPQYNPVKWQGQQGLLQECPNSDNVHGNMGYSYNSGNCGC